ncbi:helix-turn-helix domain-containing protein [Hymenobacter sp.]|uniref:helix-turn-helix domain-containing protein n=1 Tax=Hymenobacter sp. TaxID=1898978 RepID=UPI00286B8664|nr:helix-turn-helix domain-containing protein [Hymenobacter sp.]
MQTIITTGVSYAQLLEDLRALVRYEIHQGPAASAHSSSSHETEQVLSVPEAAKMLDICLQTLHDWKRRGLLPYHKLGGRTYLKRSDVLAALQGHQRSPKGGKPARPIK